jgi:hypothetical protein
MWHNEILQTHIVHPTFLCARIGVWRGQLICLRPFICNWMGNSYFAARVPNAGASCLSSAPRSVSVADLGIATLGSCSALLQSVCMPIFGGGAGIVCRDHLHFGSPWISPRRCAPRRFRRRGCYFVRAPDVRVPSRDSGLGKRLVDEREGRLQRPQETRRSASLTRSACQLRASGKTQVETCHTDYGHAQRRGDLPGSLPSPCIWRPASRFWAVTHSGLACTRPKRVDLCRKEFAQAETNNARSAACAATMAVLFVFDQASAASIKIVALGASNTYGKGVGPSLAWSAKLEAMLRARGYDVTVDCSTVKRMRNQTRRYPWHAWLGKFPDSAGWHPYYRTRHDAVAAHLLPLVIGAIRKG